LTFDPQAGQAQAGRRPALVLGPKIYNQKSGLALVCPVTNQAKGYPFEVSVPGGHGVTGVILADQVPAGQRGWDAVPSELLNEVLVRLAPLLGY
jgi:mRNA interferase MazF